MMKLGRDKIYNTLHSGTNEYNEVVMQRFSTSDNHEELGTNLDNLRDLGLNPYLCFSDDPSRDDSLLMRKFSNLTKDGVTYDEEDDNMMDDIDDLSEIECNKAKLYLYSYENATAALPRFREDLDESIEDETVDQIIIALDTGEM